MGRTLLFLLAFLTLWAKGQQVNFQIPEFNNQLTQPFIYASTTDQNGYLWFGTSEGLFRFNGKQFVEIKLPGEEDRSSFISHLNIKDNILFIGTNRGEIFNLDLKTQSITKSPNSARQKITGVYSGSYFLFSDQRSVYSGLNPIHSFTGDTIVKGIIKLDDTSPTLVHTTKGLHHIKGKKVSMRLAGSYDVILLSHDKIFAFGEGKYIISSTGETPISSSHAYDGVWHPTDIRCAYSDGGSIWIGAENGLFEYQLEQGELKSKNVYTQRNGLGESAISTISSTGDLIWLGTYGEGMKFFNPKNLFAHFQIPELGGVQCLKVYNNKDVILGGKKGLSLIRNFKNQLNNRGRSSVFIPTTSAITGLEIVASNQLIIATESSGLYLLNLAEPKELTRLYYDQLSPEMESTGIIDIQQNSLGELWVSTRVYGVLVYSPSRAFKKRYSVINGLLHNQNPMCFSEEGTWFYPKSAGLTFLKNGTDSIEYFSFQEGIKNLEFTSAFASGKEEIWLGTDGAGICIGENGKFRHITTEDGLSSNYINGIAGDNEIRVASSPKSLTLFSPAYIQSVTPKQIGFDLFFIPNAIVKLSGNNWIYGTEKGVLLHQYTPTKKPKTGKVVLQHIILNGIDTIAKSSTSLPEGNHELVFELDRISPNPYDEIPVRYRIIGFHKTWQILDKNNTISIPSIRDGNYELIISDQFGSNLLTHTFSIPPPFWKTIWFWVLVIVVLAGFTYFGIQWRLKNLKEQNQKLEEMVAERTFLLKLRNRDLEQFSYTLSHDLKNPTGNMMQLVEVLKEFASPENAEEKEIIELLETSAVGMHQKLLGFLELIKNSRNSHAVVNTFNIFTEIEKIKKEFTPSLKTANAKFTNKVPEKLEVNFNREKLISVFHNLISNAIKYRKKEEDLLLTINYRQDEEFHIFEIGDNGLGIDLKKQKDKLFGIFQRIHEHIEGTGVGLNLVKSILENNGGWIDVESEKGRGSTFFIGVPIEAKIIAPLD